MAWSYVRAPGLPLATAGPSLGSSPPPPSARSPHRSLCVPCSPSAVLRPWHVIMRCPGTALARFLGQCLEPEPGDPGLCSGVLQGTPGARVLSTATCAEPCSTLVLSSPASRFLAPSCLCAALVPCSRPIVGPKERCSPWPEGQQQHRAWCCAPGAAIPGLLGLSAIP